MAEKNNRAMKSLVALASLDEKVSEWLMIFGFPRNAMQAMQAMQAIQAMQAMQIMKVVHQSKKYKKGK